VRKATVSLLAVGVLLWGAGCGGSDKTSSTSSGSTPPAPQGTKPFPKQARASLAAGTYAVAFKPEVKVTVPAGFETGESLPDRFGIQQKRDIATRLIFQRVGTVVDASAQLSASPPPKNVVSWLKQHPNLTIGKAKSVEVGGLRGKVVTVRVKGNPRPPKGAKCGPEGPCVPLFTAPGSNELVSVFRGQKTRIYTLKQGPKRNIVIVMSTPKQRAKAATAQLERIIATTKFG
jgi:hypothetical protein